MCAFYVYPFLDMSLEYCVEEKGEQCMLSKVNHELELFSLSLSLPLSFARNKTVPMEDVRYSLFISFHGEELLPLLDCIINTREFVKNQLVAAIQENWQEKEVGELSIYVDGHQIQDNINVEVFEGMSHLIVQAFSTQDRMD